MKSCHIQARSFVEVNRDDAVGHGPESPVVVVDVLSIGLAAKHGDDLLDRHSVFDFLKFAWRGDGQDLEEKA